MSQQDRYLLGDNALSLPAESFDRVHERTVLLNVYRPQTVVAQMVRVAKPGRIVPVQEPDAAAWLCDPPHPAFGALLDELLQTYLASGKNFDRGRMAARLLRDGGLVDVQVRATLRVTRPGEYYHPFLLTLTDLVRDGILAGGRLNAGQLDGLRTELRAHLEHPHTLTCQPAMWQAWGFKPSVIDGGLIKTM